MVVAHRGYSWIYPENTIPAIEAAEPYAWGCEIDIRRTVDGQYILMHDADVDRTTDGTGDVDALTFSYIRSLDAGSWKASAFEGTQVPTVIETINAAMANDLKLCVEIKEGTVQANELVPLLTPYQDYIEVHSFDEDLLQDMADLGGDFTYVLIGSGPTLGSKIYSLEPCIDKVSWSYGNITSSIVDAVHGMDKEIYAWTVNNAATATNLANIGVDTILSDQPALIDYTLNGGPASSVPHRLKDGLLTHWAFDEGLTDPYTRTVADSSGNGNDA
ncbi:MAG: glycerophosphodiester phosphodiesterase family protein, partial [Planctomycetia bacterium]